MTATRTSADMTYLPRRRRQRQQKQRQQQRRRSSPSFLFLSLLVAILLLLLLHSQQHQHQHQQQQQHQVGGGGFFVDAVHITIDNVEEYVTESGKNVLLTFCTSTNEECAELDKSEVWTRLEQEYDGHDVGMIGDVDCSSPDDGQPLCEAFDVQTFPTILVYYGDDSDGDPHGIMTNVSDDEVYDNSKGLDYESLSAFAKDKISKFRCTPFRMDACNDQQQTIIKELQSKSLEELNDIVTTVTDIVEKEEQVFNDRVSEIQKLYEQYVQEYNIKMDDIKTKYPHYEFIEQIVAMKTGDLFSDEEFDDNVDDDEREHEGDDDEEKLNGDRGGPEL